MSLRRLAWALAMSLLLLAAARASAYVLLDDPWPDGTVTMNLQLGSSPPLTDGSANWDESAESALAAWNAVMGREQFRVVRNSSADKGDGNGANNVFFANDIYGMAFGSGVLAVTTNWARRSRRTEADVIFNDAFRWDSYDGTLRRGTQDFHRVALHEFGHVVGLDHPDEYGQTVDSVMNSHVSNVDRLQSDDIAGAQALYGAPSVVAPPTPTPAPIFPTGAGPGTVSFPPRNESLDFRLKLEAKYRDGLGRGASQTAVDSEGDIVWTSEYERYRVNLCSHADALARVLAEIDGAPAPDVCGAAPTGSVQFPPRNEALAFRLALESKYRDGLGRTTGTSAVDLEGDVVWIQEYLRYRVNGCGHAVAVQNVLTQIDGFAAPPPCR
jgi:matrixin